MEALRPIIAAKREAEKETKGWDPIPPTAQRVILAASATNRTSIMTSPPTTIHRFLNARNATALQANFSMTYTGNNIYLPTSFYQALLRCHILVIPDPDAPTGLPTLLTPTSSAGTENSQQREMRIQFLLSMGQDRFIKVRSGRATGPEVPRPCVHTKATTFDTKLREVSGRILGRGESDTLVVWDVAASH